MPEVKHGSSYGTNRATTGAPKAVHEAILKLCGPDSVRNGYDHPAAGEWIYQLQKAEEMLAHYCTNPISDPDRQAILIDALECNIVAFELTLIDMAKEIIA
jgi:hypothetical protein